MNRSQHRFSSLSPEWQEFIRVLQGLNFGELRDIQCVDEEPRNAASCLRTKSYRFPGDNQPRPEIELEDFTLSDEIVAFMDAVRELRTGTIACLRVRHGVPFAMEVCCGN